ncbi:MAG: transporter substrate-binding domain-containing protein [Propionibacteriaceae bacterium]|nr:transporter substrate-binding domain-containing protein [Propionibacteriaceae bacterium]
MNKKLLGLAAAVLTTGLLLAGCAGGPGTPGTSNSAASLRVVGQPFTTEPYGVGLPLDSPYCAQVTQAIKDMISDGTWKAKLDAELQGVSFTPNPSKNPPSDFTPCAAAGNAALVTPGKLTIGIKFDQPHLGYKDGDTYTGFDVDVATYIAGKLGFSPDQIVWKEAVSSQRETLLQNHQVDMILATYSITADRQKKVAFAGPYFVAGQDLLVRSNETAITGPNSLDGKKLCSVSGSTSAQYIQKNYASQVQLVQVQTYSECVTSLLAGRVDAVTTDDIILAGLAAAAAGNS